MIRNKDVDEILNGIDEKYVDEACDPAGFYARKRRNTRLIASVAAAVTVALIGAGMIAIMPKIKGPVNGGVPAASGTPSATPTQGGGNTGMPLPSPTQGTIPVSRPTDPVTPAEEPVVLAKTPIVVIRPTKVPTPAPTLAPGRIPEGLTEEHRAKVDPALASMEASGESVDVEIFFGNYHEEGERVFREQYPKEYKAYLDFEEHGDNLDDPANVDLIVLAVELHNTLPLKWFEGEKEKFYAKYPELKANVIPGDYNKLTLSIPYSKILELAMDPQVRHIFPYENPSAKYRPRVIGEYNGHNVYDIEYYSDNIFFEDDYVKRAGDFICKLFSFPGEMQDDDYLRIAFGLDVPYQELSRLLAEKAGVELYGEEYEQWKKSAEGQEKLAEIIDEYLETAAKKILEFGWPVLRDSNGTMAEGWGGGRYISVLATKKQLTEFIPRMYEYINGHIEGLMPTYDDTCVTRLYFDGSIRAWLNGCEYGDPVDGKPEETVKIIYSEGHPEHDAVPETVLPGKVKIMQASLAKALKECNDANVRFPVKIVMQEDAYIRSGYMTNIGIVDSPLSDPFVFEGRNYAENVAYYAEEPNLKAFNEDYAAWVENVYFSKEYEENGQDPLVVFKALWRKEKGEERWNAYVASAAELKGFLDAYSSFIDTYEEQRNGYMIDFGRGKTNRLKDIMSIEYGWGLEGMIRNGAQILDDISNWYELSDTCCMLMTKEQIERIYSQSDRCGYLLYWADLELYPETAR